MECSVWMSMGLEPVSTAEMCRRWGIGMKESEFRGIREDALWDSGEAIVVQIPMVCDGDM